MVGRNYGGAVVRGEPWVVAGRRITPLTRVRRFVRRFGDEPETAGRD